jgi:hypothetical protein
MDGSLEQIVDLVKYLLAFAQAFVDSPALTADPSQRIVLVLFTRGR